MHTPENPVWGIDGYCYLAAINNLGLKTCRWPKKPTIYTVSHFHYRYRRHTSFSVSRTGSIKWHIELTPGNLDSSTRWRKIDHLAQGDESYEIVGSYPKRADKIAEENSYHIREGCPRKRYPTSLGNQPVPIRVELQDDETYFHTWMNPVWNKEGYCYLQIIRPHLLHTRVWPKKPMVKTVARFNHSYRKRTAFTLKEVANGQYHIETGQQSAHIGWDYLASLGNSANST